MKTNASAWHGSQEMKDKFVAAAIAHREADEYLQGTFIGGDGRFQACSVGCSLATVYGIDTRQADPDELDSDYDFSDHQRLADELGVPVFLTRMQDRIFEGLPEADAVRWTERLFSAIPPGADLDTVHPRFLVVLQRRTLGLVDRETFPDVHDAISGVIDVLEGWVETGCADESAARSAAESARSAESAARSAESAAWSAARSAALEAARSAAWSAESARSAARSAAWSGSAARSAARSAAWSAEYQWMADMLISCVGDA